MATRSIEKTKKKLKGVGNHLKDSLNMYIKNGKELDKNNWNKIAHIM